MQGGERKLKIMDKLSHLDAQGRAKMVDVSDKDITSRIAVARGTIHMRAETLALILANKVQKGDVFQWLAWRVSWRQKRLPSSFLCAIRSTSLRLKLI